MSRALTPAVHEVIVRPNRDSDVLHEYRASALAIL